MADHINNVALLIFSVSNAGGSERIACGLANELSRRGYGVSIINVYNRNESFFPLEKKVRIKGLFSKPTAPSKYHFPFIPFRMLRLLKDKNNRPDVIIGVGTDLLMYALPAVKLFNIRYVSWEHFNFTAKNIVFLGGLGRKLSSLYADALVVLTTRDQQLFREHMKINGQLLCIPNFMTFPAPMPAAIDSNIAIAMGRYTYQKGFDNLIQIWEKVSAQLPQWTLQIIGDGEDKPLLEKLIREKGLEQTIELVPLSSDVTSRYQQASVLLLSSRWEGLPMVAIEAKSFGLPIVSFDCETGRATSFSTRQMACW